MAMDMHAAGAHDTHVPTTRRYAWTVFALTFGLMLSDYLSRQVITPIFPALKSEWSLSDAQLGLLVSVVALIVGVASLPIALLADRWGRVKSITLMAGIWCLATIGCGFATGFGPMLAMRALVGLGEAGYGSAGGAILSHVFPPQQRSAVMGTFLAGALFGSVLGVVLGGYIASNFGWRWAFWGIGAPSLLLVMVYPLLVKDYKTVALNPDGAGAKLGLVGSLKQLFASRTALFTYVGSGLAMFMPGVLNAWLPTFVHRSYHVPLDKSGLWAGVAVLVMGVGMIVGGSLVDRLGRREARNKLRVPAAYGALTCVLLGAAFLLPAGALQIALLLLGAFVATGHAGAAAAIVIDVTHPGLRATALAVVVLANNLIGFAPGPVIVGAISDWFGLSPALAVAALPSLAAALCFVLGSRHYERDRGHFAEPADAAAPAVAPAH